MRAAQERAWPQRDSSLEQRLPDASVRRDMVQDAARAGRRAHQRHGVLAAVEQVDVLLHPLHREALIVESGIHRPPAQREARPAEPAQHPEPVVGRHPHHRARGVLEEVHGVAHRRFAA